RKKNVPYARRSNRGRKFQDSAIGWPFILPSRLFNLAIGMHSLYCSMTRRERVTEIIEIKPRFFQGIPNFDHSHRLRVSSCQQRTNGVCQVWSSVVQHCKQLCHLLLIFWRQQNAAKEDSDGFLKAGNLRVQKVPALNSFAQIRDRFIECLDVLV